MRRLSEADEHKQLSYNSVIETARVPSSCMGRVSILDLLYHNLGPYESQVCYYSNNFPCGTSKFSQIPPKSSKIYESVTQRGRGEEL